MANSKRQLPIPPRSETGTKYGTGQPAQAIATVWNGQVHLVWILDTAGMIATAKETEIVIVMTVTDDTRLNANTLLIIDTAVSIEVGMVMRMVDPLLNRIK